MNKSIIATTLMLATTLTATGAFAAGNAGEAIFKTKCASCHPDGGNIINAQKPLKGIKDPKKILSQIRKGGGGMPVFDSKAISDAEAKQLAAYIIKTFKK